MKFAAFRLSLFVMLFFGSMDMSRGIAGPLMQHDWRLNYLQLGTIFVANSLGYLGGSFVSGFAADRYGLKPVMVAGGFLCATGLGMITGLHSFNGLLLGFLCMGIGTGWMEIGINSVIPAISTTPSQQAAYFNVLHGFYGLGACGFPLIAVWMIQSTGGWRVLYVVLLVVSVAIFAIIARMNFRSYRHRHGRPDVQPPETPVKIAGTARSWLRDPVLYLLLAAILAYVMAEGGVGSWLPTYLVHTHGYSVADSSLYLSGFYLTFTIGRLTGKYWVNWLGELRSVLVFSGFAIAMSAAAIFVPHAMACMILAGFGFSIVFPTITSVASHTFAEHAGKVLGFLFTAGGIGSLAVNGWIGYIATRYGLTFGFSFILVFLVLVIISIGLVALLVHEQKAISTRVDVA